MTGHLDPTSGSQSYRLGVSGMDFYFDMSKSYIESLPMRRPEWLNERIAKIELVAKCVRGLRDGAFSVSEMLKNENLSIADMLDIASAGSLTMSAHVAGVAPKEVLSILEDENVEERDKLILIHGLREGHGGDLSDRDRAITASAAREILESGLEKHADDLILACASIGRTDTFSREGRKMHYDLYKSVLDHCAMDSVSAVSLMVKKLQAKNGVFHKNEIPAGVMAAYDWVSSESKSDISSMSLAQRSEASFVLLFGHPPSGYVCERELISSWKEAGEYESNTLAGARHTARETDLLAQLVRSSDVNLQDSILRTATGMRSVAVGAMGVRGEVLLSAVLQNPEPLVSEVLKTVTPDSADFRHLPAWGMVMARTGPTEAHAWLRGLSGMLEERNEDGYKRSNMGDFIYRDEIREILPSAVAAAIISRGDSRSDRDIIKDTEVEALAKSKGFLARMRSGGDVFDVEPTESGVWLSGQGYVRRADRSMWSPARSSVSGPGAEPTYVLASSIRAGVALGTDDTDLLIDLMENDRECQAGPIAAMRIVGHPDVRPLKEKPEPSVIAKAREMLRRHSEQDRTDRVGPVIAEAAVMLREAGFAAPR